MLPSRWRGWPPARVDPQWPQPLPEDNGVQLVFGQVTGTGKMAGEFKWIHHLAIAAKGNLNTSEVGCGRRTQKSVWVNR